jgi:hypothetical protein
VNTFASGPGLVSPVTSPSADGTDFFARVPDMQRQRWVAREDRDSAPFLKGKNIAWRWQRPRSGRVAICSLPSAIEADLPRRIRVNEFPTVSGPHADDRCVMPTTKLVSS